jgi:hypothetical protein
MMVGRRPPEAGLSHPTSCEHHERGGRAALGGTPPRQKTRGNRHRKQKNGSDWGSFRLHEDGRFGGKLRNRELLTLPMPC